MFFISKKYNIKDRYKKVFVINKDVFYVGDSSISLYNIDKSSNTLNNTKWMYKTILDSTTYSKYIILLTFDSLIVLNQKFKCIYKYELDVKYTHVRCYDYLLILWNKKGKIMILHILDIMTKIKLNYPLHYDFNTSIVDLEFINEHLYVLSSFEIFILEYSGQFIEFTNSFKHKDCYKIEQECGNLVIIAINGIYKRSSENIITKIMEIDHKIVNFTTFNHKLYYLSDDGVIHKTNGIKICKIEPSIDFIIVENLILTVGKDKNAVYNLQDGAEICTVCDNIEFKAGSEWNNTVMLSDGEYIRKLILTEQLRDISRLIDEPEQLPHILTFKTHSFLIYQDKILLKMKKKEQIFEINFYTYKVIDESLIAVSKEKVIIISPCIVTRIDCQSSNCLINQDWVILYNGSSVYFVDIKKKKKAYLQVFEHDIINAYLCNNLLIYKTVTKSFISSLINGPKPYTILNTPVEYCNDSFIVFSDKVFDLQTFTSYEKEDGKYKVISLDTIRISSPDDINIIHPSILFKLGFKDAIFSINEFKIYFSKASVHVYKEDKCLYSVKLGDYCCFTVDKMIYVGYFDHIIVYEIDTEKLTEKYRVDNVNKPLMIQIHDNFFIVSLENAGLALFRGNEMIHKDFLYRTITNFIIFNNKIYCISFTGCIYIYNLFDLKPLASIYVGKCLCLFFKNSVYYVTTFGEIGEIIEISKDTANNLSRLEGVLVKNGFEYFPEFTRSNFYCLEYLKEVTKLEDVSLFKDFKNIEITQVFNSFILL